MRNEEIKAIENAAVKLNNAMVEEKARKSSLETAIKWHKQAEDAVSIARAELIKVMGVGRHIPIKSIRIPDTLSSVIVQWVPGEDVGGAADRVSVYLSNPNGAELIDGKS